MSKRSLKNRWRCDHCKKFINELHCPMSLEGIVSKEIQVSFGICLKCFDTKGVSSDYWDKWAISNTPSN